MCDLSSLGRAIASLHDNVAPVKVYVKSHAEESCNSTLASVHGSRRRTKYSPPLGRGNMICFRCFGIQVEGRCGVAAFFRPLNQDQQLQRTMVHENCEEGFGDSCENGWASYPLILLANDGSWWGPTGDSAMSCSTSCRCRWSTPLDLLAQKSERATCSGKVVRTRGLRTLRKTMVMGTNPQGEWLASGGDAVREQRARLQKRGRKRRGRDIGHEVADACRIDPPVRNLGLESDRD